MSEDYGMTMNMSTIINGDDMEVGFKYDDTCGGKIDVTKKGSLNDVDDFVRQIEREALRQYRQSVLPKATADKETSRIAELEAEVKRLRDQLDQMTAETCGSDKEKCQCDKPDPKPAPKKHIRTARTPAPFGIPEFNDFLNELFSL